MNCPNEHGRMKLIRKTKTVTLACNIWDYAIEVYVCPVCGIRIEPADKGVTDDGSEP